MGKITLVLGGARSGKSAYALKIAGDNSEVAFVATSRPTDAEMRQRISLHKKSRPKHWKTFEEPRVSESFLKQLGPKFDCIIIDCLTLLVSNLMLEGLKENIIKNQVKKMLSVLGSIKAQSIIVSNEVGLGIVPENKLARNFRDVAGRVNQIAAENADEVMFIVSGLSWKIKPRGDILWKK